MALAKLKLRGVEKWSEHERRLVITWLKHQAHQFEKEGDKYNNLYVAVLEEPKK